MAQWLGLSLSSLLVWCWCCFVCRGGPLGPFFEQFGAVPAGPMTAYKLLKNNEQVVSTAATQLEQGLLV